MVSKKCQFPPCNVIDSWSEEYNQKDKGNRWLDGIPHLIDKAFNYNGYPDEYIPPKEAPCANKTQDIQKKNPNIYYPNDIKNTGKKLSLQGRKIYQIPRGPIPNGAKIEVYEDKLSWAPISKSLKHFRFHRKFHKKFSHLKKIYQNKFRKFRFAKKSLQKKKFSIKQNDKPCPKPSAENKVPEMKPEMEVGGKPNITTSIDTEQLQHLECGLFNVSENQGQNTTTVQNMNHLATHNNINHIKKFIHNNYDNNDVVTSVHNHLVFCTKKKYSRFTGGMLIPESLLVQVNLDQTCDVTVHKQRNAEKPARYDPNTITPAKYLQEEKYL